MPLPYKHKQTDPDFRSIVYNTKQSLAWIIEKPPYKDAWGKEVEGRYIVAVVNPETRLNSYTETFPYTVDGFQAAKTLCDSFE